MQLDVQRRLGHRVRELRQRRDFTQEQLAERCELTAKSISTIERGKVNVPLSTMAMIAKVLGVTISELTLGVDAAIPRELRAVEQLLAGRSRTQQTRILVAMQELLSNVP
jgi:transcriptional regulator with XRE-family HTH domain